jgi:hypothetical protein
VIYVASSWRNLIQPGVVHLLRRYGLEVYDFRNPAPGNDGFRWSECAQPGTRWQDWTPEEYRAALDHPIAKRGFGLDFGAMRASRACVLVLPAGRSASIEAGYFVGAGKVLHVLLADGIEPELMYRMALETGGLITTDVFEIAVALGGKEPAP